MEIKLIINSRLSYYFCGSVSLSILNNISNPLSLSLDSLTKQEIIGLNKAVKTGVIKVVEGEAELLARAESFVKRKEKKEAVVETTVELTEEVKETKEETREPIKEDVVENTVEEVKEEIETEDKTEVQPKTTTRRRTAIKK